MQPEEMDDNDDLNPGGGNIGVDANQDSDLDDDIDLDVAIIAPRPVVVEIDTEFDQNGEMDAEYQQRRGCDDGMVRGVHVRVAIANQIAPPEKSETPCHHRQGRRQHERDHRTGEAHIAARSAIRHGNA